MSHHFDTPTAREDPPLNLCDFYLFAGAPGTMVMAMTVNAAATADTPAPFRDEALYVFRFDTDEDRREDASFKVQFGALAHVPTGGVDGHAQSFEVPNALLGNDGAVHAWPTVSLFGHAPEQQVARWGLPLFTHLFLNDDDLREAFNRTPPAEDNAAFVASTLDTVTKYVTRAGTSPDPAVYARRVAELFGPMTLPYSVGTQASVDYTCFNGRALADNVMDNMLSVLTNSPLGTGIAPDPARIADEFPYFSRPVRA